MLITGNFLSLVSGQLNQSLVAMETPPTLDMASQAEHLRHIWRELGVGAEGFLTLGELAIVCHHIGMDEMEAGVRNAALTLLPW